MIVNKNFQFEVSLSKDAYANKEIANAMIGSGKDSKNKQIRKKYGYKKGIGYERTIVTPAELLEKLEKGHVFCHLFNPRNTRKDGTFGSCEKKDMNFAGSYVIGVDIDETKYNSLNDYISCLRLKPTFWYTTYSNGQPGKGLRFRLIYVFDTLIKPQPMLFRFYAYFLNKMIEQDTNEEIEDDCNLRCSQYFNGTNINNPNLHFERGLTNNIYKLEEIVNVEQLIDFIDNRGYYRGRDHDDILVLWAKQCIRLDLSGQMENPIPFNSKIEQLLNQYFPHLLEKYKDRLIPAKWQALCTINNTINDQFDYKSFSKRLSLSSNQPSYSGLENGEQYNRAEEDSNENPFKFEYHWELDLTKGENKKLFCQENPNSTNNIEPSSPYENMSFESWDLVSSNNEYIYKDKDNSLHCKYEPYNYNKELKNDKGNNNQNKANIVNIDQSKPTKNSYSSSTPNKKSNTPSFNQPSYSGLENGEQGSKVNISYFLLKDMDNMNYNQFNSSHGFQYELLLSGKTQIP